MTKTNQSPFETLSQPAQRALAIAGIVTLHDLAKYRSKEVLKLHGMGKYGVRMLTQILAENNLKFREG